MQFINGIASMKTHLLTRRQCAGEMQAGKESRRVKKIAEAASGAQAQAEKEAAMQKRRGESVARQWLLTS